MITIGVLEHRRASFAQRSWGDAHAQFATADAAAPLDLDDLDKLALAAYRPAMTRNRDIQGN